MENTCNIIVTVENEGRMMVNSTSWNLGLDFKALLWTCALSGRAIPPSLSAIAAIKSKQKLFLKKTLLSVTTAFLCVFPVTASHGHRAKTCRRAMAHYGFILTALLFCSACSGQLAQDKKKFKGNILSFFLWLDWFLRVWHLKSRMISAYFRNGGLDRFLCVTARGNRDTNACQHYKNMYAFLSWFY